MLHITFFLIGHAVSEKKMFEYYGDIREHGYCHGVGAYEPLGSYIFSESLNSVLLPITCKTFTLNDILNVFPIHMDWRPMLTLS